MTPEPLEVPQDFYDMLMALPDGADVSEFFEFADPPTGAAPGAAEE